MYLGVGPGEGVKNQFCIKKKGFFFHVPPVRLAPIHAFQTCMESIHGDLSENLES